MKKGKVSESVLRRSVYQAINSKRKEVIKGAGIGLDCAFLSWENLPGNHEFVTAVSTQTMVLPVKCSPKLAIHSAVNNLAAEGAQAVAVTLSVILPLEVLEAEVLLKEIMKQADSCCRDQQIQIAGGHTEVSDCVRSPIITATAIGYALPRENCRKQAEEDIVDIHKLDIVMSKWAGLEGTVILSQEKEKELSTRYPLSFIKKAQDLEQYLSAVPEAAAALRSGVHSMHDIRSGGVYGALWELSKHLSVGLNVNLKWIPVKQETIEICEFFNLNPYEILSGGSMLMAIADGKRLVKELAEEGIFAAVIGQTSSTNDKIITNEEENRYLEPAKPDEINKINFAIGG